MRGDSGQTTNFLKFLGTAGARFVVARQLRASGGVWYSLDGFNLLVDPGPGSLVRALASRPKLDPAKLDGVLLTHRHLDHSCDVNIMVEAMTDGGTKRRGRLFAPADALETDPPVLQYVRTYAAETVVLHEGGRYKLTEKVSLTTPVRHDHSAETFGLLFDTPLGRIGHVVDTAYFDGLEQHYPCDLLILHVVRLRSENDRARGILHLNMDDVRKVVAAARPRLTVLTHFGMAMLRAKPWELAAKVTAETGLEVVAATDGMTLRLDSLSGQA